MDYKIIILDLNGVNSYLIKIQSGFLLIDTGGHLIMDKAFDNKRKLIEDKLEENGCFPGNLKLIILTHGDNDHIANALYLSRKYDVKVAIHKYDTPYLESPSLELFMQNQKYSSFILKLIGFLMNKKLKRLGAATINEFESFSPDLTIEDGHDFHDIGFNARVIHIPGHTPGSIGILTDEGDFFSGDTLVNMFKPDASICATDFTLLKDSIKKLRTMDIKTVYPGHGKPFNAKNGKIL